MTSTGSGSEIIFHKTSQSCENDKVTVLVDVKAADPLVDGTLYGNVTVYNNIKHKEKKGHR